MKFLMIGILSVYSLGAFANKDWDRLPFDQQKQMKSEKLEKMSVMIQKEMTCVKAAKNKSDLKGCHEKMESEKQAMMEDWKKKNKQSQEQIKMEEKAAEEMEDSSLENGM